MHPILLSEELYQEARCRATDAGFASVDEYVADVVHHDLHEEPADFDHLFTAERMAELDRALADVDAGRGLPRDQVEAELAQQKAQWLRQNQS
jgi:hypothetical protein